MKNQRRVGSQFEDLAVAYLEELGLQILDRNVYCKFGELDIVALDYNMICFIEVKYRKHNGKGNPLDSVTFSKQKTISNCAAYYLMKHPYYQRYQMRFDVIGILDTKITYLRNAFGYVGAMK